MLLFFFSDSDNEKLSALSTSNSGSLSSIITTSIASSDPDHGSDKTGHDGQNEFPRRRVVKEEEWWKTTLQVSIPFFIAGIGTIGAGVILGRVEVIKKSDF